MTEVKIMELTNVKTMGQLREICDWCEEVFGPSKTDSRHRWIGGNWHIDGTFSFKFVSKKDAMLFRLRWL